MAWTLYLTVYLVMTGVLECDETEHGGELKELFGGKYTCSPRLEKKNKSYHSMWGPLCRGKVSIVQETNGKGNMLYMLNEGLGKFKIPQVLKIKRPPVDFSGPRMHSIAWLSTLLLMFKVGVVSLCFIVTSDHPCDQYQLKCGTE